VGGRVLLQYTPSEATKHPSAMTSPQFGQSRSTVGCEGPSILWFNDVPRQREEWKGRLWRYWYSTSNINARSTMPINVKESTGFFANLQVV
jgi:hypothetical protein